jgi:hypothetical protein
MALLIVKHSGYYRNGEPVQFWAGDAYILVNIHLLGLPSYDSDGNPYFKLSDENFVAIPSAQYGGWYLFSYNMYLAPIARYLREKYPKVDFLELDQEDWSSFISRLEDGEHPTNLVTEHIRFECALTKKNYPAIWESGGGYTNTGYVTIVANPDGSPKRPVYVRNRGHLACGDHALHIVREGDIIITADHHRRDFNIKIWRIRSFARIRQNGKVRLFAVPEPLAHFSMGEWDNEEVAARYEDAIRAAMEKATCYHCREPHFILIE